MIVNVAVNATFPFAFGRDVHLWTSSVTKSILYGLVIYGGFFLVAPLIIAHGWSTVRQPGFLAPLLLAVLAAVLWSVFSGIGVAIILVLVFLHWRHDLSGLGIRSSGWRGDVVAIVLIAILYVIPRFFRPTSGALNLHAGLVAGLFRLLGNPATSAEYLFYFGFIAVRLAKHAGPLLTPIIVGLMYVSHEMSNPEYWYEGVQFGLVFVGVAVACAVYLWRRSIVPIWLGDGLARFFGGLLA